MKRSVILRFAALFTSAALPAQSILDSILTAEKAVPTVNQALAGTWLVELHRPGASAAQLPTLNLITFQPDGTAVASTADGTQATNHGVWVRVGDPMYVFGFDVSRALTTVAKVRINAQGERRWTDGQGHVGGRHHGPDRESAEYRNGWDIFRSAAEPGNTGRLLRFSEGPVLAAKTSLTPAACYCDSIQTTGDSGSASKCLGTQQP